jgi:hypothetical protein
VLALPPERRPLRRLLAAGGAAGVLLVPLAVWSVQSGGSSELSWVNKPTPREVFELVQAMGGGDTSYALLVTGPAWALGLWLTWRAWQNRQADVDATWSHLFVSSWMVVPMTLMVGVSIVHPVFVPRYLIFSMPAAVLLAAIGLGSLRRTALMATAVTAALALSAVNLVVLYDTGSTEEWRAAERYIHEREKTGDALFLTAYYVRLPFDYYGRNDGIAALIPPENSPEDLLADVRDTTARRVWLVVSHDEIHNQEPMASRLSAMLAARGRLVDDQTFTKVHVMLYDLS